MEYIGKRLREERDKKGISEEELASRVGISKEDIVNYEKGIITIDLNLLTKIIDELELDFWDVCSNLNMEIEAASPYKEGIEFADEVLYRVNRKKLVKEWLEITSKEEVLYEVIKGCVDLGVSKRIKKREYREYSKKFGILDQSELYKQYWYFKDLRENIYNDTVEKILKIVDSNMELAEKMIKFYCE